MWKSPWGLKEGFAVCGGLFFTGILLQATVGNINWEVFAFPVNVIVLGIFLVGMAVVFRFSRKVYLFGWMGRYPAAVAALTGVVAITIVMGLIRQKPSHAEVEGFEAFWGFSQMLSSWPFVLLYGWLMTLLGVVTLRRLFPFHGKNIPFLLNHLGLFIALVGAVFGNADMERLEMTTQLGKPEWRAIDPQGELKELPVAIELNRFTIDEYPPKLMMIDNATGSTLPKGNPANVLLEEYLQSGKLLDWEITVDQHIPQAASMATEDTLRFVEFHSMGATYAIYVKARNTRTHVEREGWISHGSFMFPYKALRLDENRSLIMPEREPQRYASDVTIYTESGKTIEAVIEVNKPQRVEGWDIYQVSYDESKGKWSDISVFELVRDPWLPMVYGGIWMMIAGAVGMFVTAGKRKENVA